MEGCSPTTLYGKTTQCARILARGTMQGSSGTDALDRPQIEHSPEQRTGIAALLSRFKYAGRPRHAKQPTTYRDHFPDSSRLPDFHVVLSATIAMWLQFLWFCDLVGLYHRLRRGQHRVPLMIAHTFPIPPIWRRHRPLSPRYGGAELCSMESNTHVRNLPSRRPHL
jgi:hypothetical protein